MTIIAEEDNRTERKSTPKDSFSRRFTCLTPPFFQKNKPFSKKTEGEDETKNLLSIAGDSISYQKVFTSG
jgi:hypothetical protein